MSDFKGTQGHWEAVRISRDEELKVIVKGSLKKSPGMRIYTPITDEIENKHDAKLIAAAPELLEALQETVEALKRAWNTGAIPHDIILEDLAHRQIKVIAKALGQ